MSLLDSENMPHRSKLERISSPRTTETIAIRPSRKTIREEIPTWVQNASNSEITDFQKQDQVVTHRVSSNAPWGARPKDKITITAGPEGDVFVGAVFEFKAEAERTAGYGLAYTAFCELDNNPREAFQ